VLEALEPIEAGAESGALRVEQFKHVLSRKIDALMMRELRLLHRER
jgi:hypothetical protein